MRRYTDDRDRLEKEREEVKCSLANLKKERRETKEELSACQGESALPVMPEITKSCWSVWLTPGCCTQIPSSRPR